MIDKAKRRRAAMGMLLHQWLPDLPTLTLTALSALSASSVFSAPELSELLLSVPLARPLVEVVARSNDPVDRSVAPTCPMTCLLSAIQRKPRLASSLAGSSITAR